MFIQNVCHEGCRCDWYSCRDLVMKFAECKLDSVSACYANSICLQTLAPCLGRCNIQCHCVYHKSELATEAPANLPTSARYACMHLAGVLLAGYKLALIGDQQELSFSAIVAAMT